MSRSRPGHRTWAWFVPLLLILLGLALRVAVMLPLHAEPPNDPDNYLTLARSIADGHGFRVADRPTAYRPPLYPVLLAPGVAALGLPATTWVVALHLVAGTTAIGLTGLAARRWGLSDRSAALAMFVVACDPVLVSQSRGVMTEPLAAALVAAMLATVGRTPTPGSAALSGLVGGLAALCRPSLLPATLLISATLLLVSSSRWNQRVRLTAAMLAAMAATMSPWAIRNTLVLDSPIWTTTHGGYTLLLANNEAYFDDVLEGPLAVWSGPNQARWFTEVNRIAEGLPEPEADRLFRRMAIEAVRDRPKDAFHATLGRISRFWGISPSSAVYGRGLRLATSVWTVPLWIALALGLGRWSTWQWPRIAAPAMVISLALVHCIYWTDLRMRAPVVPAIALIAAGALAQGRPGCHRTSRNP